MRDDHTAVEDLLHYGRKLVADGLVVGSGGNLSALLDAGDEILITPSGYSLAELGPEDLVRLDLHGQVRGGPTRPSSEWHMHVAAYTARPDARVVFHLHPPVSMLLDAIDRPIRHFTSDHAYYVRDIHRVPYVFPGTQELGDAVARELDGADVVLVKHHGCLITASSAELAYQRALNLEAAATATYRALLLGDETTACPPEFMEKMRALEAAGVTHGKH